MARVHFRSQALDFSNLLTTARFGGRLLFFSVSEGLMKGIILVSRLLLLARLGKGMLQARFVLVQGLELVVILLMQFVRFRQFGLECILHAF